MPKHRPIRFQDPKLSEAVKEQLRRFMKLHPVAASVTKAVFAIAAFGGAITIATALPNLIGVWSQAAASQKREQRNRYNNLWKSFYRLKKTRDFECIGEKNGEMIYKFTNNGKEKLRRFLLETLEIATPHKWDGRWRVLIFDIPESHTHARRAFQRKLSVMGFYPLQKSVWVHPLPCEEEIEFLKDFFNVKPYVDILYVEKMTNGKVLYYFRNILKSII